RAAMTRSIKKRLIGLGSLIGVLLAALLVAPAFVDVNVYRTEIINRVKQQTGRDLVIDGPINLWLLPPSVRLEGIKVRNLPDGKVPNVVEIKSVTVRPSLLALLVGQLQIGEVTVVEPRAFLEVDAAGRPNWEALTPAGQKQPAANSQSLQGSLGQLIVENGAAAYDDARSGLSMSVEKANVSGSAGSLLGPFALSGDATVNGAPLKLDLALGAKGSTGHATNLALQAGGGRLSFNGSLRPPSPAARPRRQAPAAAPQLLGFLAAL